ncbi:MAG TPA: S8 family serine peptidase [Chloroflexia bacterium]|nr:S8 family serine peptidase [Chloroflexia bacterium]
MSTYFPLRSGGIARQRRLSFWLVLLVFSSLLLSGASFSPPTIRLQPELAQIARQSPDQPVSIIVQKSVGEASLESQVASLGGVVTKELPIINAFSATLPASRLSTLGQTPGVKWVSLDAPVHRTGTICLTCIDTSNLQNIYTSSTNASEVWNNPGGTAGWLQGQGIGVAVVDSGVNPNVKDFLIPAQNGWTRVAANVNFNPNTSNISDGYGHGTLVAGVIAGNGTLSSGAYIGIAPEANIISVKVADDQGLSTASDVVNGLQWVLNNKDRYNIRVVNLSLNSSLAQSYNQDPLDAAAEILWFNGIVVVVSAGNNGNNATPGGTAPTLYPPANDPFVITVGAVDNATSTTISSANVAPFSAYNLDETGNVKPDLVAPGRNIISTIPTANIQILKDHPGFQVDKYYMRVSGTSFAAPQVAGAAALLLQAEPGLNPDQVKTRLKATALQNVPRGSWDKRSPWLTYNANKAGAGFLDIYAAVTQPLASSAYPPANYNLPASRLLWSGSSPVTWSSVNWSSVNWSSVNWSSVNWSSVNWSSVNWSSDYWGK